MTISRTLKFRGSVRNAILPAVFDGAADHSRIDLANAEALGIVTKLPEPLPLAISGEEVEQAVSLEFKLNDLWLSDVFMVTMKQTNNVIIGELTMRKWKIKLDFDNDEIVTDPRAARRILYATR